jgi:hypothetical protein
LVLREEDPAHASSARVDCPNYGGGVRDDLRQVCRPRSEVTCEELKVPEVVADVLSDADAVAVAVLDA